LAFEVFWSKTAKKQLKKIPREDQLQILEKAEALSVNPLTQNTKKLTGFQNECYRLSCGKYKMIFQIHERNLFVLVIFVGNRQEIY